MTVYELIKLLMRFRPDEEVCLLSDRTLDRLPEDITEVRRSTKAENLFNATDKRPVIID